MKYFIGGVGNVFLFSGSQLVARANTLIDSTIEISTDAVEARGGDGNKLLGRLFHSSTFKMTLTDQVFNLDYVALNLGSSKVIGGTTFKSEQVKLGASGVGSVVGTPVAAIGTTIVGWANLLTTPDTIQTVEFTGQSFTFAEGVSGQVVCITYPVTSSGAEVLEIPSAVIPSTCHARMIAKLYRADGASLDVETSTLVGTVEFDVPRLQFSGAQTISMTSTGVSNTPLEATALAVDSGTCDGAGSYGSVIINIDGANWYDKVIALAFSDADVTLNSTSPGNTHQIVSYGIAPNTVPYLVTSGLTYVSSDTDVASVSSTGLITSVGVGTANITVSITSKSDVKAIVKVTVE